jgi:hypothetical protein
MEGRRFKEAADCGFALPLRQVDYALLLAGRLLSDGRRGIGGHVARIHCVEELGCTGVHNNIE